MRLKALKTEQWSFRWTLAGTHACRLAQPALLPFYGNDVVDFFLRVPSERLADRRLQTAYLKRHHPDLARVIWQDAECRSSKGPGNHRCRSVDELLPRFADLRT